MHRSGFRAKVKQIPPQTMLHEAPLPALERKVLAQLGELGGLIEGGDRSLATTSREVSQALLRLSDADVDLAYSVRSIHEEINARMDILEQTLHGVLQGLAVIKREMQNTASGVVKSLDKPPADYSKQFADVKHASVRIVEALQPALKQMASAMDEIRAQEPRLPDKAEKTLAAIASGLTKVNGKVEALAKRPEPDVQSAIDTALERVEPALGNLRERLDDLADREPPVIAGLDSVMEYLRAEKKVTRDREGNINGWKVSE